MYTPNDAITFVSSAFVGPISDPELTCFSGLLLKLQGKKNVSVMADRGFTIQDQLQSIDVALNIPPFLIHVEHAIGCSKNFTILKGVFSLKMACLVNQGFCRN